MDGSVDETLKLHEQSIKERIKANGWGVSQATPHRRRKRYRYSSWTPAEITTSLWLDAADAGTITEAAGFVSQWDDKSGNGNDLSQGAGSLQPSTGVRTINGRNALYFNNSGLRRSYVATLNPPSFSLFMVVLSDVTDADTRSPVVTRYDIGAKLGYMMFKQGDNSWAAYVGDGAPYWGDRMDGPTPVAVKPTMLGLSADETSSSFRVDGRVSSVNGGAYTPNPSSPFFLGCQDDAYRTWDGLIAEVVLVPGVLDSGSRLMMEAYLVAKWGIPNAYPTV